MGTAESAEGAGRGMGRGVGEILRGAQNDGRRGAGATAQTVGRGPSYAWLSRWAENGWLGGRLTVAGSHGQDRRSLVCPCLPLTSPRPSPEPRTLSPIPGSLRPPPPFAILNSELAIRRQPPPIPTNWKLNTEN